MAMAVAAWTPAERLAWAPPERLSPSAWSERFRVIVSKDAAEPGAWRNARAPYLVEILDSLASPDVDEVILRKATRVGGSETGRNWLAWSIDQDPGPVLCVYPDQKSAEEQVAKEIVPLVEGCEQLKQHLTGRAWDLSKGELELTPCRVYIGWSGSAQSLAARTIRRVWLSEVDKFSPFSGRDADPVSLARRRVQTFGERGKVYAESSPTTRDGYISRLFDSCEDRRHYHVPCPHCGLFQPLTFDRLRWPKDEKLTRRALAEKIEAQKLAYYECAHCRAAIHEHAKGRIVEAGAWVSEGYPIGEHPVARRRGYAISGLCTLLGLSWHRVAAQFLRAMAAYEEGDIGPLYEFTTQVLGEPWEDRVGGLKTDAIERRRALAHPPRVAPRWAGFVLLSVDTQADSFWWTARAWGREGRSRLLEFGQARTWSDLEGLLEARYSVEGRGPADALRPRLMVIDAGGGSATEDGGSRTHEVYQFARRHPQGRVIPTKGWGGNARPARPIEVRKVTYTPPGRKASPYDVILHLLDTDHFKDLLAARIRAEGDVDRWELCATVDAEYERQMTSEHKIVVTSPGGVRRARWVAISHGRANHLWDCEVGQLAAAEIARAELLPDEAGLERERDLVRERRELRAIDAPRREREMEATGGGWRIGR